MAFFVLIVNHNCSNLTSACIQSVRAHCSQPTQYLIADNGSKDETKLLASLCPDITTLRVKENRGFAHAINLLLSHHTPAPGDYVLILNPDTYCTSDFITPLLQVLQSESNIHAVSPTIRTPANAVWYAGGTFSYIKGGSRHRHTVKTTMPQAVDFLTGCVLLTTYQTYKEAGGFPEYYFLYFEDVHFSRVLTGQSKKMYWVPSSTIYHHVSATTDPKSTLYIYLFARNRMWLMRDCSNNYQYSVFLLFHLLVRFPLFFIYFGLLKGNSKHIGAFIQGIRDGFYTPANNTEAYLLSRKQLNL